MNTTEYNILVFLYSRVMFVLGFLFASAQIMLMSKCEWCGRLTKTKAETCCSDCTEALKTWREI